MKRLSPIVFYAAGALLLLLLYAGMARWYTGTAWSFPLDDPFIYLQYAKQTAAGHLFQYNTGDTATSGCTSLLFALLLVPGFWIGLDGLGMVPYVLLLGTGGLAGSAFLMHRLAERWCGRPWGGWAGLLTLLCGPLAWGVFSGMEIPLVSVLLLWLLDRADRVIDGDAPPAKLILPGCLTALSRPEGWLAVIVVALLLVGSRLWLDRSPPRESETDELPFDLDRRGTANERPRPAWRALAIALVPPIVIGLLPGTLFWLSGSTFSASGVQAKSLLTSRPFELPEVLRETLFSATEILKGIFAGSLGEETSVKQYAYDMNARAVFFAPLTFLLFVLGLAPAVAAEWRRKLPGRATLIAAWFLLLLVATASLLEADAHFNRYQMPLMPLFLLGAIVGAVRAGRWAARAVGGAASRALAPGLLGFLALFGCSSTLIFAVHYGDNASDIERLQMTMARVIDKGLPEDAVVAVNDVGILRYLSNRRTLDLVGLTSPGLAQVWRQGSGSLIEFFENQDPSARPTHFAIFPNWFQLADSGLLRRMHTVRLHTQSIVDKEKVLYRADWSGIRTDDGPCDAGVIPPGLRIVDRIDFADLGDEAAHGLHHWQRERGLALYTTTIRATCAGDPRAFVDGGRMLTGGATMRLRVDPGKPVSIVLRTPGGAQWPVHLRLDGNDLPSVRMGGNRGQWVERVVATIPAESVTQSSAELTIEADTRAGADWQVILSQLWVAQP